MKIGTKANAIDDLGKFDGSKMTIKVNGKQIYPQKRYSIVRVDNCPSKYEKGFNDYFVCDGRGKDMRLGMNKINCKKCRYGDTKEQLIKKVAQAIKKSLRQGFTKGYKEIATDVVEFLGVEE